MSKDNRFGEFLLFAWLLGAFDKDKTAQELYDDGYPVEETAEELDMNEEDVREIVGEDEDSNYSDYDY